MILEIALDVLHLLRQPPDPSFFTFYVESLVQQGTGVALGETHRFLQLDVTAIPAPHITEIGVRGSRSTRGNDDRRGTKHIVDHLQRGNECPPGGEQGREDEQWERGRQGGGGSAFHRCGTSGGNLPSSRV